MTRATAAVQRRPPEPTDAITWEPSERWVRGKKGALTVVDSRRPLLVWEPGKPMPLYAFPRDDVRTDLLRPATRPKPHAHAGSTLFYDLVLDGDVAYNAAWTFPGEDLAGYIAFEWFGHGPRALDHWYEEDEEIFVHPRDPHKRVDALRSTRHVRVEIGGTLVADTHRPVLLFETGLPVRYYIPRDDVRLDLLVRGDVRTSCPYKGTATEYWSLAAASEDVPANLAWSYPDPLPAVAAIAGRIAFYNEVVDIAVDDEQLERPVTEFSRILARKGR